MSLTNLQSQFDKKWIFIILGTLILVVIVVLVLALSASPKPSSSITPQLADQYKGIQPTQSVEVQKAVAQQMKVDQEYAGWQGNVAKEFPWMKKLPLTTERYYVYYDLNENKFIGRLYLKAGDNVDQIKADIMSVLKDVKGVPVEKYTFDWSVNPQ